MATVMGGVGYGLYFTAKRYILPLVAPPTQPQLEQDKASIDESFKRAFDLLDQLNTDTAALKASEEARTTRLDSALGEMESVLASLKESSKRQGDDNRRIEDDVRGLRDLIPKAMDAQKENTDIRLKEHQTEYGTHWNFFLTIGLIPILQVFLHPLITYSPISLLGVTLSLCKIITHAA